MVRAGLLIFLLSAVAPPFHAQQPFVSDDAEVTPKKEWHFEYFNQYATLSKNAAPDIRQNWSNFVIQYGLLEGLEVNVDFPILYIQRGPESTLGSAFGLGDTDFAAKYKLLEDDPASMRPALALTAAVEFPTGNKSNQLGSGYTDVDFNSIVQKTFAETTIVHLNFGYQVSGNTLTGAIGIKTPGHIFTTGLSVVQILSSTLSLGIDLNGATTRTASTFDRELQLTIGGNYQVAKTATFDFAVLVGWYSAPRVGVLIGTSISP
ncbi:MAG TPA: hypothetical protein VJA66_02495 [Thermoanaerobaculia bacterium]